MNIGYFLSSFRLSPSLVFVCKSTANERCPSTAVPFNHHGNYIGFPTRNSAECLCRSQPYNTRYGRRCRTSGSPAHSVPYRSFDPSKQHGIPRHKLGCITVGLALSASFPYLFFPGRLRQGQTVTHPVLYQACVPIYRNPDLAQNRKNPLFVCPGRPLYDPPKPIFPFLTDKLPL